MKILLHYLQRYRILVFFMFLLAVINQGFSLIDPMIIGKIISKYGMHAKDFTLHHFLKGVLGLIGLSISVAMISRIAKAFQDYYMNLIIQKFGVDVYTDGLQHALKLPFQEFEDQRSGETLNILQKVRIDTEKFIQYFINIVLFAVISIAYIVFYSISVYPKLILIYFIASGILYFVMQKLSKKIKEVQQNIVRKTNQLAGATTESLRNIELIKSLGLTQQEVLRLNNNSYQILELELEKVKRIRSLSFIQGTLVNTLRQGIVFALMYLIFRGKLDVGQLYTLQIYSFFIFNPLQEMGNVILSYREAQASLLNFQKLINTPTEQKPEHPEHIHTIETLEFRDVTFQHKSSKTKAVEHIYFNVRQGDTIAFVGPSGSGKTTLVKLLVGLYLPENGKILYNGIDSSNIDIDELRQQIGFVTQETQLFAGTIKENLLFVNPQASDSDILQALQQASCDNLLSRSDNNINSVIGEGGMKISGGEKQRLSIARALLRHPKLLVFDEATSALDSLTEEEITATIKNITAAKEHITVMIAHRLSTIMHADKIFVLEKGKIIETGKHSELIAEKGLYYAMWRQQIGER